jgi:single-strand DNA-binding protein
MARKPALAADVQADVTDTPSKSRSYGINHFRLLGRMTGDPQQRFTQTGKAVLNIGIATNVNGFPEFHDVVAWEKAAEVIGQYGRKGREIHVEGRITSRVRDVEGQRVKQLDLVVESFQLLGPAPTGEAEA